jgi:galactarate dehydratase
VRVPPLGGRGDTELAARQRLDAGGIATGEATIEETGWELFRLILDVAGGRTKVWSDRWGIHNDLTLFTPGPVT